jgi:hypothetical protein
LVAAGKVVTVLIISLTKLVVANNAIKVVLNAPKDHPDVQSAQKDTFWIRNLTSV